MARIVMNRKTQQWQCVEEEMAGDKIVEIVTIDPAANYQAWIRAAENFMPGTAGEARCFSNATAWMSKMEKEPKMTESDADTLVANGDNGALHFDSGKARYDLLPPEAMDALARHYTVGCAKYAERNWERGMTWGRCFGSVMRHSWAWMRGEDIDPETGSHHMIAVAWNALALFVYHERKIGADDRPVAQKQVVVK